MGAHWLLLIYTVPADPSRLRAAVWRDLKRLGAVYLRDGVCVLPQRPEAQAGLAATAARIDDEFGGQATLVENVQLPTEREEWVRDQAHAARAEEYAEVEREAQHLLDHIQRETEHREFSFAELEELDADLGKLKRWLHQIRGRDYFAQNQAEPVHDLLGRCEQALAAFLEEASNRAGERG
jgi:hypothetical protein